MCGRKTSISLLWHILNFAINALLKHTFPPLPSYPKTFHALDMTLDYGWSAIMVEACGLFAQGLQWKLFGNDSAGKQ